MTKDFICYPAVIEKTNEKYKAHFPNLDNLSADGNTIKDTLSNCKEKLSSYYLELEKAGTQLGEPGDPKDIELKDNQMLIYVDANIKWFKERDNFKSVTKAVTLPKWLNNKAVESGINVSSVLQRALMETLNVEEPK